MEQEQGIYKWKYKPTQEREDAYSAIMNELNFFTPEEFNALAPIDQYQYVNKVLKIIRSINVFPIYYFNEKGIIKEIQSVREKEIAFTGNQLITQSPRGLLLLDYLFPNLHLVDAGNQNGNCMYNRFFNNEQMRKILAAHMSQHNFNNLRTPFFTYGRYFWNTAINFSPIRAKAIYERFCPPNGVIFDYSAGFGGRMLGALASKNNYTYYAVEPNSNTYYNLNQLGQYIQTAFHETNPRFRIVQSGSEDFMDDSIKADFIFSCPPFFALERYTDEATQSNVKYPQYGQWLEYYARPTIKNCKSMLKSNGLFAIDILDFYYKSKKYHLVEDWIKIIEEEGFDYVDKYPIITHARKKEEDYNTEQIYLFKLSTDTSYHKSFYESYIPVKEKEIKIPQHFARYDVFGNLNGIYESIKDICEENSEVKSSGVREAIKSGKAYKGYFYRSYNIGDDPAESIEIDYLCEVDGIRFIKQTELASYLGVSRQAVSAAKARNSTVIAGKTIEWKI